MRLTFELPEGRCEHGFEQCPNLNDDKCWACGYPPLMVTRDDVGKTCRVISCPFHGVVRVTVEDSNA